MDPFHDGKGFLSVARRLHGMTALFEKAAHRVPDEHRVVHNQSDKRRLLFDRQSIPRATLANCYSSGKGKGLRPGYLCHAPGSDSLASFVSSMAISLNSLASKISRHSRHSTNSVSSSRATI